MVIVYERFREPTGVWGLSVGVGSTKARGSMLVLCVFVVVRRCYAGVGARW